MKLIFRNTTLKFEKGKPWEERTEKHEFNLQTGVGIPVGMEKIASASQFTDGKFAMKLVAEEGVLKQDKIASDGWAWNYNLKSSGGENILANAGLNQAPPCKDGIMYVSDRIPRGSWMDTYLYIPNDVVLKNGKVTLYIDFDYKG